MNRTTLLGALAVGWLLPISWLSPIATARAATCADHSPGEPFQRCPLEPPPSSTSSRCLDGLPEGRRSECGALWQTPAPGSRQDCWCCTPGCDDDDDGRVDEEVLNGADDDQDGLYDEDISCRNWERLDTSGAPVCQPSMKSCPIPPSGDKDTPRPWEVTGGFTLEAAFDAFDCAGDSATDVRVTIEQASPYEVACQEKFQVAVTVREPLPGSQILYQGKASLVLTRRWESLDKSLLPLADPAAGAVQVFRFDVRADLARVADWASLPAQAQVACMQGSARKHAFFYGHLDVARDSEAPLDPSRMRTALVLAHAPGRLSHPENHPDPVPGRDFPGRCGDNYQSRRPIDRCDASGVGHERGGWFLVGPRGNFQFDPTVETITGDFSGGRNRAVPCSMEVRIGEFYFEDAGVFLDPCTNPPSPCARVQYRRAQLCGENGFCSNSTPFSFENCDTINGPGGDDVVATIPVGKWTGGAGTPFPRATEVSVLEGTIGCLEEPTRWNYWYGTSTHSPQPAPPAFVAPERTVDLVDNYGTDARGRMFNLIGACQWFDWPADETLFGPLESWALYFFDDHNPHLNRDPAGECQAHAVITSNPAVPRLCGGGCITLSGAASTVRNCCQCGGLEYRWRQDTALLQDWSPDPDLEVCPSTTTTYTLDVRCNHNRNHCTSSGEVEILVSGTAPTVNPTADRNPVCAGGPVTLHANQSPAGSTCAWTANPPDPTLGSGCDPTAQPAVTTVYTVVATDANGCASSPRDIVITVSNPTTDAGAPQKLCVGDRTSLAATTTGGCAPYQCAWTPATGLCDPASCATCAAPAFSTTYTVNVRDCADCPSADSVDLQVCTLIALAGDDRWLCSPGQVLLHGGAGTGCGGDLLYRWRQVLPVPLGLCGYPVFSPNPDCLVDVTQSATYELEVHFADTPEPLCISSDQITLRLRGSSPVPAQICPTLGVAASTADDDGDGAVNEELPNRIDDDGDSLVDEDIACSGCEDGIGYRGCPNKSFTALGVPVLPASLSNPATLFHWSSRSGQIDARTTGTATIATSTRGWKCGNNTGTLTLSDGSQRYTGSVSLAYARSLQVKDPALVPGASANVCVDRYLVKADISNYARLVTEPPNPWTPPACLVNQSRPVFLYGHLDLAYECGRGSPLTTYRSSLVLTHTQGGLSHPTCTGSWRPLASDPVRHSEEGWTLVAPAGVGAAPSFTFDIRRFAPTGYTEEESIRYFDLSGKTCLRELPILSARLGSLSPIHLPSWENTLATIAAIDPLSRSCGCDHYDSVPVCEIANPTLVTISLGYWTGSSFPGNQTVHAIEGQLAPAGSGERFYVYGSATQNIGASFPRLVDFYNNQRSGLLNIGSPQAHDRLWTLYNSWTPDGNPADTCR